MRRQSAIGRDLEPNSEDAHFHFCFRDRGEGAPQRYVFNPEADTGTATCATPISPAASDLHRARLG